MQILQFIVSIKDRNKNRDTTGDPWNGRTLEWSTSSPAPVYNFAHLPVVHERDAFWVAKKAQAHSPANQAYEDIVLPKNTGFGILIAGFAFLFGFAAIWHIPWLATVSLLGVIVSFIIRSNDENTEYVIPAADVRKIEQKKANGAVRP
jgi:cytochrome o ubiquinol oxidase subunit 1